MVLEWHLMTGHSSELDPITMEGPEASSPISTDFEEQMGGGSSVNFSIWVIILCYAAECLWRHSNAFLGKDASRLKPNIK